MLVPALVLLAAANSVFGTWNRTGNTDGHVDGLVPKQYWSNIWCHATDIFERDGTWYRIDIPRRRSDTFIWALTRSRPRDWSSACGLPTRGGTSIHTS